VVPAEPDGAAIIVMSLTRGPLSARAAAAIEQDRARRIDGLAAAAVPTLVRTFDAIPGATGSWTGGGVDVLRFAGADELEAAAAAASRHQAELPSPDGAAGLSVRLYGAWAYPILTPGPEGTHMFAHGHFRPELSREAGQARWKQHARLLVTTQWYTEYLLGYTQYDGLPASEATRLGLDDTNGVVHIATPSVQARLDSTRVPEYLAVLQPDDREFMVAGRGMRVFTVETTGT